MSSFSPPPAPLSLSPPRSSGLSMSLAGPRPAWPRPLVQGSLYLARHRRAGALEGSAERAGSKMRDSKGGHATEDRKKGPRSARLRSAASRPFFLWRGSPCSARRPPRSRAGAFFSPRPLDALTARLAPLPSAARTPSKLWRSHYGALPPPIRPSVLHLRQVLPIGTLTRREMKWKFQLCGGPTLDLARVESAHKTHPPHQE